MTSISRVQRERMLEELVRYYYSTGINPTLSQLMQDMSSIIDEFPLGAPYPLPYRELGENRLADYDILNTIFNYIGANLDILYDTTLQQLRSTMDLQANLSGYISNLRSRRKVLEDRVDDYLLSLYDTDGYFHSITDTFNSLSLVDLNFTSAFIDTDSGTASIPMITSGTKRIPENILRYSETESITVNVSGVNKVTPKLLSPLSNAFDAFANTVWAIEVMTYQPREVVVQLRIDLATDQSYTINKIEYIPYGIVPVQAWFEMDTLASDQSRLNEATTVRSSFGHRIQTSSQKMVFVDEKTNVRTIYVNMRKDQFDYHEEANGTNIYKYIFGAKDLGLYETLYDNEAVLVSKPLLMQSDTRAGKVIDAVSLTVVDEVPENTDISYWIAADNPTADSADDFDWVPISPIDPDSPDPERQVVRFEGAFQRVLNIGSSPDANIPLLTADTANPIIGSRNPSIMIIPDQTIYRIAKFNEAFLDKTVRIEEGLDTVRGFFQPLTGEADGMQLSYWSSAFAGGVSTIPNLTTNYLPIENGKDLYLGNLSAPGYAYLEFYLHSDMEHMLFYDTFSKSDQNSKLWDIKLYLNGDTIADLPLGTDSANVPWKFQSGRNHVAVTLRTRDLRSASNLGGMRILTQHNLNNYGTIKLEDWNYTTLFDMEHNEVTMPDSANAPWLQPASFTVYNGEIISRRRPSDNLRISFRQETGKAPSAVRLKINMMRDFTAERLTPLVYDYRVRFLYG